MSNVKKSCFIFTEGGKDYNLIVKIKSEGNFKFHTKEWIILPDHWSGSAPEVILDQCYKASLDKGYDTIICVIDLDQLLTQFPRNWKKEKLRLERKYSHIHIFWQENNLEDEIRKVVPPNVRKYSKTRLNTYACKNPKLFVKNGIGKRIIDHLKNLSLPKAA